MQPPAGRVVIQTPFTLGKDKLEAPSLRLRFILRPEAKEHVSRSGVEKIPSGVETRVVCIASIEDIGYQEETEVILSTRPWYEAAGREGRVSGVNSGRTTEGELKG